MTSRSGTKFDGYVQVNAADKKFDFTYDGLNRNRYSQENKETANRKRWKIRETKRGSFTGRGIKRKYILKILRGLSLTKKQINHWSG